MTEAVRDAEVVIHLAAETGTGQSMYMINKYNDTNIMGTSNLFQAISNLGKQAKVKKIIFSSSRSVYGEGKYICRKCGPVYPNARSVEKMSKGDFAVYCPICGAKTEVTATIEDGKIIPSSLYAFTKYSQEMMIRTMAPAFNIDYTIFRFQNVYGVGQSLKNPYTGILSIFSTLMIENKPINVFENGLESRDFINVKDIAAGVIAAINNEGSNGESINLGSGVGTTVIEVAKILKNIYGSGSEIRITGDFRMGDIANNYADISKAEDILGFKQMVSLEEGLTAFCNWVRGQKYDNRGYEKSLFEMKASGMFISKD